MDNIEHEQKLQPSPQSGEISLKKNPIILIKSNIKDKEMSLWFPSRLLWHWTLHIILGGLWTPQATRGWQRRLKGQAENTIFYYKNFCYLFLRSSIIWMSPEIHLVENWGTWGVPPLIFWQKKHRWEKTPPLTSMSLFTLLADYRNTTHTPNIYCTEKLQRSLLLWLGILKRK